MLALIIYIISLISTLIHFGAVSQWFSVRLVLANALF